VHSNQLWLWGSHDPLAKFPDDDKGVGLVSVWFVGLDAWYWAAWTVELTLKTRQPAVPTRLDSEGWGGCVPHLAMMECGVWSGVWSVEGHTMAQQQQQQSY